QISRTVHSSPVLYRSRIHPLERDESVPSHSRPSAFHGSPARSQRRPSKIRHQESRPFLPALCPAENSYSESSAQMKTTRTFPRQRWRRKYINKQSEYYFSNCNTWSVCQRNPTILPGYLTGVMAVQVYPPSCDSNIGL